jgi:hypothetical protein
MSASPEARVVVKENNVVHVHVAPKVLFDLDALQKIQAGVMTLVGHPRCTSGFQVAYMLEEGEHAA